MHSKFPEQQPAIRGVLCLCDGRTGELLAVMDSTHLTAVRTGLCSALATDVLARRDARSVAVIGAGMQGDHQLRSLHMMRQIGAVRVHDTAPDRALAFAERMRQLLGLTIEVIGGAHPGRMNAEQITVYGGVGLAFQDAVAAWQIYRAALSRGLGREIDFLA